MRSSDRAAITASKRAAWGAAGGGGGREKLGWEGAGRKEARASQVKLARFAGDPPASHRLTIVDPWLVLLVC